MNHPNPPPPPAPSEEERQEGRPEVERRMTILYEDREQRAAAIYGVKRGWNAAAQFVGPQLTALQSQLAQAVERGDRQKALREECEAVSHKAHADLAAVQSQLLASQEREKALRVLLQRLLNKVNMVTCFYRHRQEIVSSAVEELCERQILVESEMSALAGKGEAGNG